MKNILKNLIVLFCIISSFGASAQTLDEIVAKHIEAIGGKDNWAKVKTLRMESTMKAQGADIKITIVQVDKKEMRQEITVMGMTGYSIVTNTEGWSYMPFQGQTKPEAMTADDVKDSQDDLYLEDEFLTYKELGKKLEYFGKDDVDGTECFKMKMTDKNGKETTFYIDPSNYYVIKQTQKLKANGQEVENSTYFSNYKKLAEGIVFPMSINQGGGQSEIVKLEINPTVDETLFKVSK
jgi:hypothetical protein